MGGRSTRWDGAVRLRSQGQPVGHFPGTTPSHPYGFTLSQDLCQRPKWTITSRDQPLHGTHHPHHLRQSLRDYHSFVIRVFFLHSVTDGVLVPCRCRLWLA